MIEIEAPDGSVVEFPDGTPDETIKSAMKKAYGGGPSFEDTVDKDSGSPAYVRAIVGGAPLKDKLANIQQFYPDAQPYGDDNFVFTDPKTGRATLHNPPGLDVGDLAGVGREASQFVGGALGAGASVLTAPETFGGSLLAIPAAVGTGTAAGGALWDASMEMLGDMIDTRSMPERLTDTGIDFFGGAIGQRGGELVEQGVKSGLRAGKQYVAPYARSLYDDFMRMGVSAPAGAVTGSKTLQSAEQALSNLPTSAGPMQEVYERTMTQISSAADRVSAMFGRNGTKQEVGETVVGAASKAAKNFEGRQGQLYDDAFDMVGKDTLVDLVNVKALRDELGGRLANAPESLAPSLQSAINRLNGLIKDAGKSGLPFSALREVRTAIGKDLADPLLMGSTGSQNAALKRVYGALSEDMKAAAVGAGDDAAKALQKADRYTRFHMDRTAPLLEKVAKYGDEPERAIGYLLQGAKDGGSRLARFRAKVDPRDWDDIAGMMIGHLGRATPGKQNVAGDAFSVQTFMTNWNKLSPQAKNALFGGTRYKAAQPHLERLVRVVDALKNTEAMTNTSGTARMLAYQSTLGVLGAGGGMLAGGDTTSAGGGMVGAMVAPRVAARLITNPKFVQWLADVGPAAVKPNGITEHIGRLVGISKAEPAIREEIQQYLSALRDVPAIAGTPTSGQTSQ